MVKVRAQLHGGQKWQASIYFGPSGHGVYMKFSKAMLDFGLSIYQPTKKERQELKASFDLINLPLSNRALLFAEMFRNYPVNLYEAQSAGILEGWWAWPYPERDEYTVCLKLQNKLIMRDPNPKVLKPIAYRLDRTCPGHQPILDFFDANICGFTAKIQTYEHPPAGLFDGLTDLDRLDDAEIHLLGIDLIEWEPIRHTGAKQSPEPGYTYRWLVNWRELVYPTPEGMRGRRAELFHEIRREGLDYYRRLFLQRMETFNLIRDRAKLLGQQTHLLDELSTSLTCIQRPVDLPHHQWPSLNASVGKAIIPRGERNRHHTL